jgi:hypothetical protein
MSRSVALRMGLGAAFLGGTLTLAWQLWSQPAATITSGASSPTVLEGRWRCLRIEAEGKMTPKWLIDSSLDLTITGDMIVIPGLLPV